MNKWYTRTVFFVEDVQASLEFYIGKLGFEVDWRNDDVEELLVAQVSRDSCEIILNKGDGYHGKGRIFISLFGEHVEPLKQKIEDSGVVTTNRQWGMPVTEILDIDGNELFFSPQL